MYFWEGENWFGGYWHVAINHFYIEHLVMILFIAIGWLAIPYLAILGVLRGNMVHMMIAQILLAIKFLLHIVLFIDIVFLGKIMKGLTSDLKDKEKIGDNFLHAVVVLPLSFELMYIANVSDYRYWTDQKAIRIEAEKSEQKSKSDLESVAVKIRSENSMRSSIKSLQSKNSKLKQMWRLDNTFLDSKFINSMNTSIVDFNESFVFYYKPIA